MVFKVEYKSGKKSLDPLSIETYLELRASLMHLSNVQLARGGDTKAKNRLLQFVYTTQGTEEGFLKGSTRPTNTVMVDFDGIPDDQMPVVRDRILSLRDTLDLTFLERSVRMHGFHMGFMRRWDMTYEENIRWAAGLVGLPYDKNAKDITRVFFATTNDPDDLILIDERLFAPCDNIPADATELVVSQAVEQRTSSTSEPQAEFRYHGIAYADIIAKYWELYNEGRLPSEGDRNAKTFELAAHLAPICDYSLTVLENIVPLYDGLPEDEWRQCLQNGINQPRKGISYKVQKVLKALRQDQNFSELGGSFSRPPQQPAKLPPLLRDLLRPIPKRYRPYVSEAVFPALGTHLHGVRFRTVLNELREPNLMALSVAQSNAGKASADKPINFILAPIKASDAMAVEEENEWKRKNPTGKTKAKDPRPDICIQVLVDNLTEAAFNLRVIDANRNEGRRLYLKVDELEALRNITSRRSMEEVSLLTRKAFDNAEHGQGRVGPDSVSGTAPLRFNYNAMTSPARAKKLLHNAIIDGTVGRLNVLTIVVDENDDELPIYGDFDEKYAARLAPYLSRLDQASGVIDCPKMRKFFLVLDAENKDIAARLGSLAYENLMHRALIIAQSKAIILYIAHGHKWTKEIEDYVRWSLRMDLWCKLRFFGETFEQQFAAERAAVSNSPRDLISQLPDEFTEQMYMDVRRAQGCKGNGKDTLRQWKKRDLVFYDDVSATFVKTDKAKQRIA